MQMSRGFRYLFFGLKAIAAIIIIWALVAYGKLDVSALSAATDSPGTFIIATCLLLLTHVLVAYRWRLLLSCQSTNITIHEATSVTFFALFIGSFLPGGMVAGDAARIAYLAKLFPVKKSTSITSIFADRLVGLYSMLAVCCAAVWLNPVAVRGSEELQLLASTAGALFLAVTAALLGLHIGLKRADARLRDFIGDKHRGFLADIARKTVEALWLYRHHPWTLLAALAISITSFVVAAACMAVIGHSLIVGPLGPLDYAFAAPWAWLANLLPATPGGLGIGEAVFDQICRSLDSNQSVAAYGTVFLAYRITAIVAILPGLAIYLFRWDSFRFRSNISD